MESFLSLTAVHIANFFLVLGILSMFKFSKKTTNGIVVFDCLFYFGIAVLFFTPYVVYIPISILSLMSLNRFKLRDFLNAVIGFILPFFIVWGFMYFFQGNISMFSGYNINTSFIKWIINLKLIHTIPLGLFAMILVLNVVNYSKLVRKNELMVQKKINILYYLLTFSLLSFFLLSDQDLDYFLILSLPSAIILGMISERVKAPALEEFAHLVSLVLVFFIHFSKSIDFII